MLLRTWLVLLLLGLLVPGGAGAQGLCGDLDVDGDVDADDAAILRGELAASSPMALDQALSCDVIEEPREAGLEPDPADLAGRCSMSDSAVMVRNGDGLPPAPAQSCALGATTDCCSAHSGVGCNAANTVECVCALDATCCTVDWDAACAALACGAACAPACSPPADSYCAGACRDTDTDLAHCGACNAPCALPNASEACSSGSCVVSACDAGFCDPDANPANGCENALNDNPICPGPSVGSVPGDMGGPPLNYAIQGEQTFRIRITEEVALGGDDPTARLTLTSPPGADYDLFVRCLSCAATPKASSPAGANSELIDIGRDDLVGDASFEVFVEVRWISGSTCDPWTLTVVGNTVTTDRSCN